MFPEDLVASFRSANIIVVGDIMLDRYIWGAVDRVSPEAPVPVVRRLRTTECPGGAANIAANLSALGAHVSVAGVVGQDESGSGCRLALIEQGVDTTLIIEDGERTTTVKTRIIAQKQQMLRIDEETTFSIGGAVAERILQSVGERIPRSDGLILSDYAKGVLTPSMTTQIIALANEANVPVFVDPKGRDHSRYAGATVIKPNLRELAALTECSTGCYEEAVDASIRLFELLRSTTTVLTTVGADGMILVTPGEAPSHIAAREAEVYDVTGAGDTALAAFVLAWLAGVSAHRAAEVANAAASIVIGRIGTSVVTNEALLSELAKTVNEFAIAKASC